MQILSRLIFIELRALNAGTFLTTEKPKKHSRKADSHAGEVGAPISGNIVRVMVQDGAIVQVGEALLTVTAMKMVSWPRGN